MTKMHKLNSLSEFYSGLSSGHVMNKAARTTRLKNASICRYNNSVMKTDSIPYQTLYLTEALKACIMVSSIDLQLKMSHSLPIADYAPQNLYNYKLRSQKSFQLHTMLNQIIPIADYAHPNLSNYRLCSPKSF